MVPSLNNFEKAFRHKLNLLQSFVIFVFQLIQQLIYLIHIAYKIMLLLHYRTHYTV